MAHFLLRCIVSHIQWTASSKKVPPSTALSRETIPSFVDRAVQVINLVREFEICAGVDSSEYKEVWPLCSNSGVIDTNPYKECRYSETFRSKKCEILVSRRKRRCAECSKTVGILGRKLTMVKKDVVHPNTPNIWAVKRKSELSRLIPKLSFLWKTVLCAI